MNKIFKISVFSLLLVFISLPSCSKLKEWTPGGEERSENLQFGDTCSGTISFVFQNNSWTTIQAIQEAELMRNLDLFKSNMGTPDTFTFIQAKSVELCTIDLREMGGLDVGVEIVLNKKEYRFMMSYAGMNKTLEILTEKIVQRPESKELRLPSRS